MFILLVEGHCSSIVSVLTMKVASYKLSSSTRYFYAKDLLLL